MSANDLDDDMDAYNEVFGPEIDAGMDEAQIVEALKKQSDAITTAEIVAEVAVNNDSAAAGVSFMMKKRWTNSKIQWIGPVGCPY
jgi:uncharacterized membrane protein